MQNVIIDRPYEFVPPRESRFWHGLIQLWLPRYLKQSHGVETAEMKGTEYLRESLGQGHGILLAPNHCRPCDPMVLALLSRAVGRPFHVMASWHVFMQSRFMGWLLPRAGAFSVYREGLDRVALKAAMEILERGRRPLVIFPEGVITRTNDRIGNLMEGTAFIARSAAKHRMAASPPGKVVIHPVAIRYYFRGDLTAALGSALGDIEKRLSWRPQAGLPIVERVAKVGQALLALKEMEYLGQPQPGTVAERLARLIDHLVEPLEKEWLNGQREKDVVARVKRLRVAILPDMIEGDIAEAQLERRWRQLADLYLAQQLSFYPPDYLSSQPTAERLLETVERFEEDITDQARVYRPLHVVIEVGRSIEVSPGRERGAAGDPLMQKLRDELEALLKPGANDAVPFSPTSPTLTVAPGSPPNQPPP